MSLKKRVQKKIKENEKKILLIRTFGYFHVSTTASSEQYLISEIRQLKKCTPCYTHKQGAADSLPGATYVAPVGGSTTYLIFQNRPFFIYARKMNRCPLNRPKTSPNLLVYLRICLRQTFEKICFFVREFFFRSPALGRSSIFFFFFF